VVIDIVVVVPAVRLIRERASDNPGIQAKNIKEAASVRYSAYKQTEDFYTYGLPVASFYRQEKSIFMRYAIRFSIKELIIIL
jgi:hypothetical protein